MTGRERFFRTLRFEEPDRPPHFESMFELEKEAFGLSFPDRNSWAGCTKKEKEEKIAVCLAVYERIIERFGWDALSVYWPWSDPDGIVAAKKAFGRQIAIGGMLGEVVFAIENIADWPAFAAALAEDRASLHAQAEERCRKAIAHARRLVEAGADFIFVLADVAFNGGPFISPADFAELVTPYLRRTITAVREMGAVAIYHSDGNLMPILDQIISCRPHALMSIDPMAGMDIAVVKKKTCGRLALMGNVQCSLLQDGPKEAIRRSARYCLEHAAPGGGYIFSTSNTIFPGMPLENYEYMLSVFHEFNRQEESS